jgi:hypothetical protein
MASAYATLNYLKEQGPTLQERLNERTAAFARRMNRSFQASGAPLWVEHFSSFVVLKFTSFQEYSQLLFYHLHNRGIFTYEGRPAFFTTAHTDEDFDAIARAFDESIDELQRVRLLPGRPRERRVARVQSREHPAPPRAAADGRAPRRARDAHAQARGPALRPQRRRADAADLASGGGPAALHGSLEAGRGP